MSDSKQYVIAHYHEIGLKGKNRDFFENKLIRNIKRAIPGIIVKRISGRILLEVILDDRQAIEENLKKVFGIAYFAFAESSGQDLASLKKNSLELIKNYLTKEIKTFRVTAKRSNKDYPMNSPEIERLVGEEIFENSKLKVSLKNPDITCFIEIVEKSAFIYFARTKGAGGLPVGTAGKTISLISSGFDSPVASWMAMKRGAEVIFVHFHSYPSVSKASIDNVKEIVKVLTAYQFKSKLYLVSFLDIQKEIIKSAPAPYRVVLYRRMMVRIANKIAEEEQALALITGDNLGQVASQTLENIKVINDVSDLPIFRPLIGFDKEEIISLAKKINTYDISRQPYEDCCSLFVPQHPVTKAKSEDVEKIEQGIASEGLIDEAIKKVDVKIIAN